MIKGTFKLGGDLVEIIVDGTRLMFSDISSGTITTIEGLKLNQGGVIKEFPDLTNDKEWRAKAIERFKEHIKNLEGESRKLEYIRQELNKHGYEPLFFQIAGFRPKKFR